MKKIATKDIKKLREETGAPVMDCKRALEESQGDSAKAKKILAKWGIDRAQKKKGRTTEDGLVYAYIHPSTTPEPRRVRGKALGVGPRHGGKIGVLVEVNCETDFVAKTGEFQKLAHEVALQITSMNPQDIEELLGQPYIRDLTKTIQQLVDGAIGKVGENVRIKRFVRYEVGE